MDKEQEILNKYFSPLANNKESLSLTNDAAFLDLKRKMVVSTDMMIEGQHFNKNYDPKVLAKKLLRINLSDIAAMGAKPYGYLLNLSVPGPNPINWIKRFVSGLKEDHKKFKLKLFGGDLSKSPIIFLSASIFGLVDKGIHKKMSAREGSEIFVSGNLGNASLGYNLLNNRRLNLQKIDARSKDYLIKKLYLPQPRIGLGSSLLGCVDFCTDISDGLLKELNKIALFSGLQANVFFSKIPISRVVKNILKSSNDKKKIWNLIFSGGEDYELLFSTNQRKLEILKKKKEKEIYKIGFFSKGIGVRIFDKNGKTIDFQNKGFSHF